jgi:hypothetical protein
VPADSSLGQALVSVEGLAREFSSDPAEKAAQQQTLADVAAAKVQAGRGKTRRRGSVARAAGAESQAGQANAAGQAAGAPGGDGVAAGVVGGVAGEELHAGLTGTAGAGGADGAGESTAAVMPTPVILVQTPASSLGYARQLLGPLLAPAGTAVMVLVFAVYMLTKREDLRNRLLLLAGIGRLNLVTHALDDAGERISRFLIANVLVNAGFGVVFAAGLYAIGVPYATLWGALLALLRTIPYAGPLVGGALPTLFALIYFPTWWQGGAVVALIGLLEILVSNFLEPWLYGGRTGISELALLAMAIVWTLLWGWPGLALSTPLTVCLIVVGRTMPQMSFLHILLGDDAELAPEARFYERMLALDSAEAQGIVERFLAERPAGVAGSAAGLGATGLGATRQPMELYDRVLLPALTLAESDRHKGTLEEGRAAFFLQSAAELVADLAQHGSAAGRETELVVGSRRPVVCVPASDQADEIAATMLAQLLEAEGHKTLLLPAAALSPALLQRFAEDPETSILISALPPFAFAGAQLLYRRLRAELPGNRIVIGLWGSRMAPERIEEQMRRRMPMAGPGDGIVTSMEAAVACLRLAPGGAVVAEAADAAGAGVFARAAGVARG